MPEPLIPLQITGRADQMGVGCLGAAALVAHATAAGYLHCGSAWLDTDVDPLGIVDQVAGDGTVIGTYQSGSRSVVVRGADVIGYVSWSDYNCGASVQVAAATPEAAASEMERLCALFPALPALSADERSIFATYWFATAMGPSTFRGLLPRVPWSDIADNYATPVRAAIDQLCELGAPDADTGKVILLHGPPGTGKSRMLAALANEWSAWADLHVVTDPAQFFEDRSYLMSVAERFTDGHGSRYEHGRWAVMVLEDADKFIDKRQVRGGDRGDGINALLNMADGMLAVSMRVMFVLTTNVNMDEFDPALTRPGRCLANIHVPTLSQAEAVAWLSARGQTGGAAVPDTGMSLAELYDRTRPATTATIVASGAPAMTSPAPKTIVRVHSPARFTVDPANTPIVASGGTVTPLFRYAAQPRPEAFRRRNYKRCTPVEVNAAGEVFGHVWDWTKPHIGYNGQAVYAPRSRTGYGEFLRKPVTCEDGSKVFTGPIYIGIDHAPLWMAGEAARDWMAGQIIDPMANTRAALIDCVIYEDEWGGQIAGAFRPHATAEQARIFEGSDVSPDWRPYRGGHAMYGMICVNTSGLTVFGGALVASGGPRFVGPRMAWDHENDRPLAMVAVGMVHHEPVDEIRELRREVAALSALMVGPRADEIMARLAAHPVTAAWNARADEIVARADAIRDRTGG